MKIDQEFLLEKQKQYAEEFSETIHKLNNPFCNTPHLGGEVISLEAKLSLIKELYDLLEEDEYDLLEEDKIEINSNQTNEEEIKKELDNIKNIFQDMENIVKKDMTKDILSLKKELYDLQFKYQEELIEKTFDYRDKALDDSGGFGITHINPEYFKQNAELELLPLLRKIYDKQYEIEELEYKFASNIKQSME